MPPVFAVIKPAPLLNVKFIVEVERASKTFVPKSNIEPLRTTKLIALDEIVAAVIVPAVLVKV